MQFALIAGDQAEERFAHREAERHYRAAVDVARSLQDIAHEALILERLGRVLTNYGRYEDARDVLHRAVPLYRETDDQVGEVRTVVQLGSVYRALGSSETAIPLVHELLERIQPSGRPQDLAELNIVLETLCYATGRYQEGLEASERAAELARATGDMASLVRAETGRGTELIVLGHLLLGVEAMEGAIAIPAAEIDPYNLTRLLENAAEGHRMLGNLERSRELVERSLRVTERIQSPWDTAIALSSVGATYRLLGDWAEARMRLEASERLGRSMAPAWWATYGILELAALCLDEGDWDSAAMLASQGADIARTSGHLEGMRGAERLLAELDIAQGRPEEAIRRLEPLLDRPGLAEAQVTEFLPTLASAFEALGDYERAETTIEEAASRAIAVEAWLLLAEALIVQGQIRVSECRWDDAERDFDEVVRLCRVMPYPHLEGRALYETGLMLILRGDAPNAHQCLTDARTIFERLGAKPYIERTKQALDALGTC